MMPLWVRDFVGVPFLLRGRTLRGVDCYGLICLVYARVKGVALPLHTDLYDDLRDERRRAELFEDHSGDMFSLVEDPEPGDCVSMTMAGLPVHAGVFAGHENGHPYVLHITEERGHSFCEPLTGTLLGRSNPKFHRFNSG